MTSDDVSDMPAFRRHVRARILRELELNGGGTRTELMRVLVLSRTALTRVLEPMFAAGEVMEDSPAAERQRSRGRPAAVIRLRVEPRLTLAVQVTPTAITTSHVDEVGTIRESRVRNVGAGAGFGRALASIGEMSDELQHVTGDAADRCVVILPTMIDPSGQRVAPAGAQDLMPTWIGAPQRQRIARRVHAPTWFENDGRMGALGEARFGVGRQSQSLLFAAISAEGIGGGLIIEREVYRGRGLAGEVSHIGIRERGHLCPCGQRGCVAAEVRAAMMRLRDIGQSAGAVQEGAAAEIIEGIAEDVGRALAAVCNVIHPEVVALSDRLGPDATGDVVERIAASIRRYAHPSISPTLRIVRSSTADDSPRRASGVIAPPASIGVDDV